MKQIIFLFLISISVSVFGMEKDIAKKADDGAGLPAKRARTQENDTEPVARVLELMPLLLHTEGKQKLFTNISALSYKHCEILAGICGQALEKTASCIAEFKIKNCYISCGPDTKLLGQVSVPFFEKPDKQLITLQAVDGQQFKISKEAALLSETLKKMIEETGTEDIVLLACHHESLPCIIECLEIIASLNSPITGIQLHEKLKHLVENTNILHLFCATNYLDIAVLFHFLRFYIVGYIVQERDMRCLECFVESCNNLLPKNLRDVLMETLLHSRRCLFMRFFVMVTDSQLAQFPEKVLTAISIGRDHQFSLIQEKGFFRVPITRIEVVTSQVENYMTRTSQPLALEIDHAQKVAVDRKGSRLIYMKKSDQSLHQVNLKVPHESICLSGPAPSLDMAFRFHELLRVFVRKDTIGKQLVIIDPNFEFPIIIPACANLLAYNEKYALTEELSLEDRGMKAVVWSISDKGTVSVLRNTKLPEDIRPFMSRAHYLLSPSADYVVFNYNPVGTAFIYGAPRRMCGYINLLSSDWDRIPEGELLCCTDTGWIVLRNENELTFFDTREQEATTCMLPHLYRAQICSTFFSENEMQFYIILARTNDDSTVGLKLHFARYDLYGAALTMTSLTILVCMLHADRIDKDPSITKMFHKLTPEEQAFLRQRILPSNAIQVTV